MRLLLFLALVGCADDIELRPIVNQPPVAGITHPSPSDTLVAGPVLLAGVVSDPDQPPETLAASWWIGNLELDGVPVGEDGSVELTVDLAPGASQTVTLQVTDDTGEVASAMVAFDVVPPEAPWITLVAPAAGESGYAGVPIEFTLQADPEAGGVVELALDGMAVCTGLLPDAVGLAGCELTLGEGTWLVQGLLRAESGEELASTEVRAFPVLSEGSRDDDADGYTAAVDCDDADPDVNPGASEVWHDGIDQDCDGNDADADLDGFDGGGGPDCDDDDPAIHPGRAEVCDGVDQDCDGTVDDGVTTGFWDDLDGDGYGAGALVQACAATGALVTNDDDCDDGAASVYPGAAEVCDGVDQDCDATVDDGVGSTWYADGDGDGYGAPGAATVACDAPPAHVSNAGDCNDGEDDAWTGASETCDGIDNDCDGDADEGLLVTYWADDDGDGYGDPSSSTTSCAGAPGGYVGNDDDCDDGQGLAWAGAVEACDGVDNDCTGVVDEGCACAELVFWDEDNNLGCPMQPGAGADASPESFVEGELGPDCTQLVSRHDAAAQVTLYPTAACTPGDTLVLYDYDSCTNGSVVIEVDCGETVQDVNLNCLGFADKPASFILDCASW